MPWFGSFGRLCQSQLPSFLRNISVGWYLIMSLLLTDGDGHALGRTKGSLRVMQQQARHLNTANSTRYRGNIQESTLVALIFGQ